MCTLALAKNVHAANAWWLTSVLFIFNDLSTSKVDGNGLSSSWLMSFLPQGVFFATKAFLLSTWEPAVRVNREIVHLIINHFGTFNTKERDYTRRVHRDYKTYTEKLQDAYTEITRCVQRDYKTYTERLQNAYREITRHIQITRHIHKLVYREITRRIQRDYKRDYKTYTIEPLTVLLN